VNFIASRKREHSRKPDELYRIIEACSWGPYLEIFARTRRERWTIGGNEAPAKTDEFTGRSFARAYSHWENKQEVAAENTQLRLCDHPRE